MNSISQMSATEHSPASASQPLPEDKRLLAIVAHELRNPLLPILNAAALLKHRPLDASVVTRAAGIIERQARVMSTLIDDLLNVSGVHLNKAALARKAVSVVDLIEQCAESVTPFLNDRRQTILIDLPVAPMMLEVDSTRICQALQNIILNAGKYSSRGAKLQLRVTREGDDAVIVISDPGVGIEADHLESIFDLFSQNEYADAGDTPSGLGIGLYLVRSFIDAHGGRVVASSAGRGKGSTFTVRLPCLRTDAHTPSVHISPTSRSVSFFTTA